MPSLFLNLRYTNHTSDTSSFGCTLKKEESMHSRIASIGVRRALELLLPDILRAGKLAQKLQPILCEHTDLAIPGKGGTAFANAVTRADRLVQNFLGAMIFQKFSDCSFYGEEDDDISAIFDKRGSQPYQVTLDPVNGTYYFQNGLPLFDVILTIRQDNRYLGAIVYVPCRDVCYIGIGENEQALYCTTTGAMPGGHIWQTHRIVPSNNLVLVAKITSAERYALEYVGLEVIDNQDITDPAQFRHHSTQLLQGELCGLVQNRRHFIDTGAVAWMASLGGGAWSNPTFERDGYTDIIAADSDETYRRLQNALHRAR